jgi:hypothetical protein
MKNNPLGFGRVQFQGLGQMPGNGLAFTVFIGGQPDFTAGSGFFKLGHNFLFIGANFVTGLKIVF